MRGVGARFAIYFGIHDPDVDYSFNKVAEQFDRKMDREFVRRAVKKGLWFHDTSSNIAPAHRALMTTHSLSDMDIALEKMDEIFKDLKKQA